jgi:hypothetical protein
VIVNEIYVAKVVSSYVGVRDWFFEAGWATNRA